MSPGFCVQATRLIAARKYRRSLLCAGFVTMLMIYVPAVAAGIVNQFPAWQIPHFSWSGLQQVQLFGIPVRLRTFTAPGSVLQAARMLTMHTDRFEQVVALKDKVVLSGTKSGWHWLAEIETVGQGVHGRVSSLSIDADVLNNALALRTDGPLAWLTHKAQLRFSQNLQFKDHRVTQQVYSAAQPLDELVAYVQKSLRLSGWQSDPQMALLPDVAAWRRKSERLMVVPKTSGNQSALFVQHIY